jgi:hypothetical protein
MSGKVRELESEARLSELMEVIHPARQLQVVVESLIFAKPRYLRESMMLAKRPLPRPPQSAPSTPQVLTWTQRPWTVGSDDYSVKIDLE